MTGPEHYRMAELLLADVTLGARQDNGASLIRPDQPASIAAAQVHATLALTAAVLATREHAIPPAGRHEWLTATDPEYAAEQAAEVAR